MLVFSTFLSSMVTSARSISDFAQTVSCDRLPQRMAARIDRSPFTCSMRSSSASVNFFWTESVEVLTLPSEKQFRRYVKELSKSTDVGLAQLTLPAEYR